MDEPNRQRLPGLQIARVLGVPVRLMPSWFFFAVYLVLTGEAFLQDRMSTTKAYVIAVSFVLILLASVLLHEIGHLVVARAFDLPVRSVTVNLLAGLTEITQAPQTPDREYAVAVTGPMVSLLLCSSSVAGSAAFATGSDGRLLLGGAGAMNAVIGILNLLPGLPLDGGRVLRSIVWQLGKDANQATRVAARAGMVIAFVVVPVVVVGILPEFGIGGRDWPTLLISALVGTFIYAGASASLQQADVAVRLPKVSVAALARPALTVPATMPLSEAVRRAQEAAVRALVVVDGGGRFEGVVSEAWVQQVPVERRPWVVVADGARRLEEGLYVDPHLQGEELLKVMQQTPASEYVVRGGQPRVLCSSDVVAALALPR